MTKGGVLALSVVCYMGFPVASQAQCRRPKSPVLFQGETRVTDQLITNGSSCGHGFIAGQKARGGVISFESASIALNPMHGTLKQTRALRFVYKPNANYKGTDEYSLKICGELGSDKGCSTINYKTTIQ